MSTPKPKDSVTSLFSGVEPSLSCLGFCTRSTCSMTNTSKIEVSSYKDGRKRYEYRHVNDLKQAHPKSMAAPAQRPKLGRPSKGSDPNECQPQSEGLMPSNPSTTEDLVPQPPTDITMSESKQRATTTTAERARENFNGFSTASGPPAVPAFSHHRPQRSTRNPNPKYVDAIWVATKDDINTLNQQIGSP